MQGKIIEGELAAGFSATSSGKTGVSVRVKRER